MALLPLLLVAACGSMTATGGKVVDLGNGILQEPHGGRMWQKERSGNFTSYEEAKAYAERLELGGYHDWRLPTIYELYDLHYLFDLHKADAIRIKLEGNYWSGEKDGEGMAGSWEIGDQCEPERKYYPQAKGYVRAVRP
ncbi:Lcl domain-containing protein [Thiovibrio sp. JS02]